MATRRQLRDRRFTRRRRGRPPDARFGADALKATNALRDQLTKLVVLEKAVELGGSDAAAAFVRLAAALGEGNASTNRVAVRHLLERGHESSAALVEALYMARWRGDYESCEVLILPYRDRGWAKTARLHLAIQRDRWQLVERAMAELGEGGPAQLLQLLLLPARDPRATPTERLRTYRLLLRVLSGKLVNPRFAQALHRAWLNASTYRLGWTA